MTRFRVVGPSVLVFLIVLAIWPEPALAQFAGGAFETKISGVTRGLMNVLLPAASVLGLIYAAVLAATGDASAKSRMVLIAIASIVGFLAPLLIGWLQRIAS